MSTNQSVSPMTGIVSLVVCVTILLLLYTTYLMQTHQHLDVQAAVLAPSRWRWQPDFLVSLIVEGGFKGTLAAVVSQMLHGTTFAAASFSAAYAAFWFLNERSESEPKSDEPIKLAPGENTAEIKGSELMVILPLYRQPGSKKRVGGQVDNNPYRQVFYRISRKVPSVNPNAPQTPVSKLYVAIYAMLNAHADVPASVGTHHADASLKDHSIAVSKKVVAHYRNQGKSEPLAAVAGLAHDLDKLLAYRRKGDAWVKNADATHHNKYAAYIVSTQPEFAELSEEDRNTLTLALRYYHDPANLPLGATQRVEALVSALRICDGYTIQEEKRDAIASIEEESLELIDQALLDTLKELNINGYLSKEEHAGGWTTPALEFVLTPMSTVLEKIGKHLTAELVRKLQLDHETRTFSHPSGKLLCERLGAMNALITNYKTFSSDHGLYDCRIGNTRFKAVLMLDKRTLDDILPGYTEKWGTSPYRIRITSGTKDITQQDETESSSDDAEIQA